MNLAQTGLNAAQEPLMPVDLCPISSHSISKVQETPATQKLDKHV